MEKRHKWIRSGLMSEPYDAAGLFLNQIVYLYALQGSGNQRF